MFIENKMNLSNIESLPVTVYFLIGMPIVAASLGFAITPSSAIAFRLAGNYVH
jgi:hypothetical protein